MKVRDALAAAAARLAPLSETGRLDADLLMARALGTSREAMLMESLDRPAPADFDALLARRLAHEPIAYILGRRDFWTIELEVGPGALVPRPDSETLIEAAIDRFGEDGPRNILDLGTGPGTLLLAALDRWPGAAGLGIDRSEAALAYAVRNATRLGQGERARFERGDWGSATGSYDLILCNPPYVQDDAVLAPQVARWEPAGALRAGPDGLDAYRRIAPLMAGLMAPEGLGCVEIGVGQQAEVSGLFAAAGFSIGWRDDLAGVKRCMLLSRENPGRSRDAAIRI